MILLRRIILLFSLVLLVTGCTKKEADIPLSEAQDVSTPSAEQGIEYPVEDTAGNPQIITQGEVPAFLRSENRTLAALVQDMPSTSGFAALLVYSPEVLTQLEQDSNTVLTVPTNAALAALSTEDRTRYLSTRAGIQAFIAEHMNPSVVPKDAEKITTRNGTLFLLSSLD
ncbi:fasciclin domain-containing protein [Candidatus Peribacteria bacterium]|nr:fasciclin domain-containing protein [Candidatus Peribacteria bacterium]